ncbi:unnamed protein product [Calypogeia fissa]
MGYAAVAVDLQGHSRSDGLKGYLPDVDGATQDCSDFFNSVSELEEISGIPTFLFGESLEGAICLLIHFGELKQWNGAILAAAMCKISDNMRPPWPVQQILMFLAYLLPTWAIVPNTDYLDKSMKDPVKRDDSA